tara:strand:- start:488 stop:607 length:120 start_codon:yes stop_codon:yes gene_type:complete
MSRYLTNCCYSNFIEPDYPDTDICGLCYEHAGVADEDDE